MRERESEGKIHYVTFLQLPVHNAAKEFSEQSTKSAQIAWSFFSESGLSLALHKAATL